MVIADEAAHHDPANEALYRKNADSAAKAISEQQARIATILAAKQMPAIFAQHDAYRYFEARFDFAFTGALYDKENQAPSPAHIAELHALTHNMAKACLLAETNIENNVVQSVFKDTELYTINANPSGVLQSSHDNGFFGLFDVLEEGLKGCAKH
jgi:zinc transport system substrate-binding protein